MADHKHLVGVVYDKQALYIRRIVLDAQDLQMHLGPGEALATGLRVHGHSLARAYEIVRTATGREPPPMDEAHAREHPADTAMRVAAR